MVATGGAQISVWVPVIVGVIGLAGVILTQVIAGSRASRERVSADKRDDVRWARAVQERQEAADREDRYRSHAERSQCYAKVILELQRWKDALNKARAHWSVIGTPPSDDVGLMIQQAQVATEEAAASLALLAPKDIRNAYDEAWYRFIVCGVDAMIETSTAEEVDKSYDDLEEPHSALLDLMRLNIGVERQTPSQLDQ